jgi:hypothetical protein
MVATTTLTGAKLRQLAQAVRGGLAERGLTAKVELERSGLRGYFRLLVTSPQFADLLEAERQEMLWSVLKERWHRKDQLRLTMTLCLSDAEARGEWEEPRTARRNGRRRPKQNPPTAR